MQKRIYLSCLKAFSRLKISEIRWKRSIGIGLYLISLMIVGSSCVHKQNEHKQSSSGHEVQNKILSQETKGRVRSLSSSRTSSGWTNPKVVTTPAGKLYVRYNVIHGEPVGVTYVKVQYICRGTRELKTWKVFKVQWFYGIDKTLDGSIVPLVYDPIPDLNLSGDSSQPSKDGKDVSETLSEEFNLGTRCRRR